METLFNSFICGVQILKFEACFFAVSKSALISSIFNKTFPHNTNFFQYSWKFDSISTIVRDSNAAEFIKKIKNKKARKLIYVEIRF